MNKDNLSNLKQATNKALNSASAQDKFEALSRAFQLFSEETIRLEQAYSSLQKQFEEASKELKQTNIVLKQKVSELDITTYYLENILSNMSQGLIFIGFDGMITTYNQAAEVILGVGTNEALFDTFWELFPDDLFGFSVKEALNNKNAPSSLTVNIVNKETQEDKHLEIETRFVLAGNYDTEEINLNPAHDFTKGLIILFRDITEIHTLQAIANRNDRMKVLGEMAGLVAHEIRNPLGGIKGFASLLMRDLNDRPELREMAAHIVQGTDSLNHLLTDILNYVRPLKLNLQQVQASEFLHQIIEHIQHDNSIPATVKFSENFLSNVSLTMDPIILKGAILNILVNAVQAMPKGGTVKVTVTEDNNFGIIRIQDEGEGIPKQIIDKIYNPFFTTKPTGHGFGLAEVHRVIQAHNAAIELETEIGKGTTFTLKFPLNNILEKALAK
jgi:signal transduction histidine kinase